MIQRKKKDNNLVLVTIGDRKLYFTSMSKAGLKLGIATQSVKYAIGRNSVITTYNDEKVTIEIIDGSEIPYKLINN